MRQHRAELVRPSVVYRERFLEALAESHAEGDRLDWPIEDLRADFDGFVADLVRAVDPRDLKPGLVPQSTLWLVDGVRYIGRLSLRHELNERLTLIGGHIGYDIRPSVRRRRYGTLALAFGLAEARAIDLHRVLITCDSDNIGSRRIIVPGFDGLKRRYWIQL